MSDPKNEDPKDDIIAAPEGEAEPLADQDLDQADGGWSWSSHPTRGVQMKTFSMPVNAETITAVSTNDVIEDTISKDTTFLRTRPGRIKI